MILIYLIFLFWNLNVYYFFSINKCNNNFNSFINEIKKKEILIIEIKNKHGECIPGFIKYFKILGYRNIEILITRKLYNQNILDFNYFKLKIKFLIFSHNEIDKFITLGMCNFYKICFLNSLDIGMLKMRKYLYSKHKFKSILVLHSINNLKKNDIIYNDLVVLKKFNKNSPFYEVNPHYFGEYEYHYKSKIINFITSGNISNKRKNFNLLIDSVIVLLSNNIFNFHVTVIGKGHKKLKKLVLKKNLTKYITFTGRLSFSLMYKIIAKSYFFLPLSDPNIHKQYLSDHTSGSFQLSYGFNIPMVIEKTFAKAYNFDDNNSIIYNKNNDFCNKLKYAINLNEEVYKKIKEELRLKSKEIEKISLENLKKIIIK